MPAGSPRRAPFIPDRGWVAHSRVGASARRCGTRHAALSLAFDGLGARLAETEACMGNAASNGVSRALGYEENRFGLLAPEGVPRETRRYRMTADGWRDRSWPPVRIEGLDACQDMFGV